MRDQLERLWLRMRLSLPTALLRGLSGGAAVVRESRTLDPRLQYLAHLSGGRTGSAGLTPDEARARDFAGDALLGGSLEPGVTVETLGIDGPDGGELELRLYRPPALLPSRGAVLYAHAGGGVIGGLESGAGFCALLAKTTRAPVLAVNYRLAPEHRFPAGLNDFVHAYQWLTENGARFGAAPGKVAVAGASIGAGFTAALCQQLRRAGAPQPVLQILLYPMLDISDPALRAAATFDHAWPLSLTGMTWSRDHYLGPEADLADSRLSPAKARDLSGLAPAIIAVAGFDPLRNQGESYALALRAAGIRLDYRRYDGLTHDFCAFSDLVPAAGAACREIAELAARALDG